MGTFRNERNASPAPPQRIIVASDPAPCIIGALAPATTITLLVWFALT